MELNPHSTSGAEAEEPPVYQRLSMAGAMDDKIAAWGAMVAGAVVTAAFLLVCASHSNVRPSGH